MICSSFKSRKKSVHQLVSSSMTDILLKKNSFLEVSCNNIQQSIDLQWMLNVALTGQIIALFGPFVAEATLAAIFCIEEAINSPIIFHHKMGKKKAHMSLYSTFVQQINDQDSAASVNEYHLIDNEYFAGFTSLDGMQEFHTKLIDKQQEQTSQLNHDDMDMKSFAEKFLVDLPEHLTQVTENLNLSPTSSQDLFTTDQPINCSSKVKGNSQLSDNNKRKSTTPVRLDNKRQRRNIRDLPQSSEFIYMSDNNQRKPLNTSRSIFDCLQSEKSPVSNVQDNTLPYFNNESAISIELAESSVVKNEPVESEEVNTELKEEPIEMNVRSIEEDFTGDLDNYVQNVHLLHQTSNIPEPTSGITSRPKRIRKRKKFYIEESELPTRSKKVKTMIRKKRPITQIPSTRQFTDAEIEQQFGERLPTVKTEQDNGAQPMVNSRVVIEFEPVIQTPQTPIEKARARLASALGRGHDPDTFLLKIRSREHKIIEVQLAIYSTADWHSQRTKVLAKIEEALRGLRVSWTKIDILVDDLDVQISTSFQAASLTPPSSVSTNNSSWFLKALSESGPLIVHIHDRRYPQQRFLIKCPCPECSSITIEHSIKSALPVIVNVSPATTPTRRLSTPTILNKTPQTNISSLHNIDTTFFNELIYQWGRNTVISVTQCVLDLALIASVHASLPSLCVLPSYSKEEYKKKYQQIIDPLKCTLNENEKISLTKTPTIAQMISTNNIQSIALPKSSDILTFYDLIKQNQANIRSAKSMRNLITTSFSTAVMPSSPPSQSNIIRTGPLILPKPVSNTLAVTSLGLIDCERPSRRRSSQTNRYDKYTRTYLEPTEVKQQAHCTPIIELKSIMGGSTITTQNIHSFTRENSETIVVRDAQNNELKKVTAIRTTNESQQTTNEVTSPLNNSARVIRLSIAKSALSNPQQTPSSSSPPTIRLVVSPITNTGTSPAHSSISSDNNAETAPLVPKQINIIKPISSSMTPAVKLSNPILISNKSQASSTK